MKTHELKQKLKQAGCYFLRNGSNHEVWYSPLTDRIFEVWRHKGEIPTGTARAILKDAGAEL